MSKVTDSPVQSMDVIVCCVGATTPAATQRHVISIFECSNARMTVAAVLIIASSYDGCARTIEASCGVANMVVVVVSFVIARHESDE